MTSMPSMYFHDGAVHVVAGLVISGEAVTADLEGQSHAHEGQGEGHQGRQRQPPVQAEQGGNADDGQYDVPGALGNHVRKQAPLHDGGGGGRTGREEAYHLVHAVERHKTQHHTQHRQYHRQPETVSCGACGSPCGKTGY